MRLGSPGVCGGTKEAESPYPRPFLATDSDFFDSGNIIYRHLGIYSTDIWAFSSALERSHEFLEAVGSGSEASDGCVGRLMRLLESFLDATGLCGKPWELQEASRTLRDDRGRLKHYACNGLEASSQAYATQVNSTAIARAEPTEHTNSTRLLFL